MHNQRDFVFFRHHRYIFEQRLDGKMAPVHKGHLASASDAHRLPKDAKAKAKKLARKKAAEGEGKAGAVQARLQELGPRFTLRLQVRRR